MDKYRRVPKEKNSNKETPEDEIRVTATGRTATYVTYAAKLFNEKNLDSCTVKATGTALATAVTIVEIIKRRFKGLHQITKLGSTEIIDEYEPLEEGLDKVTDVRQVSFIEVTLSKIALEKNNKGYQPPISEDLVKEFSPEDMARGRGGRGGRRAGSRGKGKGKGKSRGGQSPKGGKGKKGKGKSDSMNRGKGKSKGSKGGKDRGGKSKGKSMNSSRGYDSYGGGYGGGYGGSSYGYGGYSSYDDNYGSYGSKGKSKGGKSFGDKGKSKGMKGKSKGRY